MELNASREGDVLTVKLDGRLDGANSAKFEEALNAEIGEAGCPVILDLGDLAYISSAGLRAILLVTKALNMKGKKLALCSLPTQIEEVFKISGFNKIIPIHPSHESAAKAIS
ncbi:MAG: STAS domain-containing protein [Rhodobacteraceae bacterium]|nr:STAS domain-containing protein [Paracoccaceae bacterium]